MLVVINFLIITFVFYIDHMTLAHLVNKPQVFGRMIC